MLTDIDIHVPPNYTTMQPPAVGGSYVDPVFGTTITRLTDRTAIASPRIVPEYSQNSSFNLDDSYLVLIHGNGGGFHIYDGDGVYVRAIPGSSEPRWSRANPNNLYYRSGLEIRRIDAATGIVSTVATLPSGFTFGNGTGDVSDNDRIVVLRDQRYVSIWDLANGVRVSSQELDTNQPPINGPNIDYVTITKDGNSFVVGYPNGTTRGRGLEQYDVDGNFMIQLLNASSHAAMGRDVDATQVLFVTNSATSPQQPVGCNSGIVKISLDGTAARTCLLSMPWNVGRHLSAHGNDGWVYLSTAQQPPLQPDLSDWSLYANEIFRIRADGSVVERLAHHRSSSSGYWIWPHANISISGNKLVYGSDFMLSTNLGQYADTYLINIQQPGGSQMSDLQNFRDAFSTALPTAIPAPETLYVPAVPPFPGSPEVLATMTVQGVVFKFDADGELVSRD